MAKTRGVTAFERGAGPAERSGAAEEIPTARVYHAAVGHGASSSVTPAATRVSTTPVIEARNLSKAFADKVLFERADITVLPGETLGIIGESGSGKSILLKMFIGLVEPDEGEIFFAGESVTEMDDEGLARVRRRVGYVFQNDALFDSMTILDNIGYALREHSEISEEEIRARVSECLSMVGLDKRTLELYPSNLSGGMRKRVGLARAIAHKPEVILYDEPTQGLDPQNITNIALMIRALQADLRATSVVVTHDMRTAFGVCDRLALLHDRGFPHVGTPAEFARSKEPAIREFIESALEDIEDLNLEVR